MSSHAMDLAVRAKSSSSTPCEAVVCLLSALQVSILNQLTVSEYLILLWSLALTTELMNTQQYNSQALFVNCMATKQQHTVYDKTDSTTGVKKLS